MNNLYLKRSFQGANSKNATFLFFGRDPKWAIDVETQDSFSYNENYLTDGVRFWIQNNVHHPFLLPQYKGDGKRFHRMFSNLRLTTNSAHKVSFVELLPYTTTGMSSSNRQAFMENLFSAENFTHLEQLEQLITDEKN